LFSKGECQVLHLGRNNPGTGKRWGMTSWKSPWQRETWGPSRQQTDYELAMHPSGKESHSILGCIGKSVVSR